MKTWRIALGLLIAWGSRAALADSEETLVSGGRQRSYLVHLPPAYRRDAHLPLVVLLHGGGGNATQALRSYGLPAVADQANFVLVAPQGTGRFRRPILLTWNVGWGFGTAAAEEVDDNAFMRDLIQQVTRSYGTDPRRVYLAGMSNGAVLCHRAAAANADLVTGFMAVAGAVGGRDVESGGSTYLMPAAPARPVNVLLVHGDQDTHMPPGGGVQVEWADRRKAVTSLAESAGFWCRANGCTAPPQVEELQGGAATHTTWSGGRNGARVEIVLVHGNGHAWPGGQRKRQGGDQPVQTIKAQNLLRDFMQTTAPTSN